MQFLISDNDFNECFQVVVCNEMVNFMFKNLNFKDALEYALVNSCENSKHTVALKGSQ